MIATIMVIARVIGRKRAGFGINSKFHLAKKPDGLRHLTGEKFHPQHQLRSQPQ